MDIHDIIKTDNDRIFIISPECYIIFTGDTLEDQQPFIRVGNSRNLPVRVIPLVENIIITDILLGNPVNEQFNIDVQYLPSNRYIGSRMVVQKYLDFQKLFNLNLENISIVDVEKDLPEFSRQKNISDKDSFIGVFYRDGNFRIMHSDEVLIDLNEMNAAYFSDNTIHSLLSKKAVSPEKFASPGFIPVEKSLFIYRNRTISCIDFPENYYGYFAECGIDPARVRDICIPSTSIFKTIRLVKWKNEQGGKIRLFSDEKEHAEQVKRLFSRCTVNHSRFSGMKFDTGDGITITNIAGSGNMILSYKNIPPERKTVTIGYIHDFNEVEQVLSSNADMFVARFSVFESANLLFKSVTEPVLVMDDGNANIKKLDRIQHTILNSCTRYELSLYAGWHDIEALLAAQMHNTELASLLTAREYPGASDMFKNMVSTGNLQTTGIMDILNGLSLLRLHIQTTTERKTASAASRLAYTIISWLQKNNIHGIPRNSGYGVIACHDAGTVILFKGDGSSQNILPLETFEHVDSTTSSQIQVPEHEETKKCVERIIEDRKRLERLLDLYYAGSPERKKDIKELASSIREREKDITRILHRDPGKKILRASIRKKRLKAIGKKLRLPLLLILAAGLAYLLYTSYVNYRHEMRQEREKKRVENLIKKHDIRVTDTEIYYYANQVARKNGYAPMNMRSLKTRNPNWIFPGNVFTLLDGQEIVVEEGDTLWGIASQKLMKRHIQFYTVMDKLKEAIHDNGDPRQYLRRAKSLAFSEKHTILIKKVEKELENAAAAENNNK